MALREEEDRDDHDHHELRHQRDPEHLDRDLDIEVGERSHERHPEQRQPDPRDVDPVLRELQLQIARKPAQQRHAEERVGDHQREARHHPERPAQAVAHERVHAAGSADLLRHLDVADREDRQDDGREREGRRPVRTVSVRHRVRGVEKEDGERRSAGDAQEEHSGQSDRTPLQLVDVTSLPDVDMGLCHARTSYRMSATRKRREIDRNQTRSARRCPPGAAGISRQNGSLHL